MKLALGIDTSLYKTSCALANSQGTIVSAASRFLPVEQGSLGLRQQDAVFLHVRQLPEVLKDVLRHAQGQTISAIGVSERPADPDDSYMPVFLTGVAVAQSLSLALNVSLVRTTHQRGHLRAAMIGHTGLPDKLLAVHLSGGTTDVLLRHADGSIQLLAKGLDLHAGQLVDRVGVAMGYPFPAGRYLDELALTGRAEGRYPVSIRDGGFHLSGAETAALRDVQEGKLPREAIAAEVLDVIVRSLLRVLKDAADYTGTRDVLVFGGVAASRWLKNRMMERNQQRRFGLSLHFGQPEYAGDNAAGIALLALEHSNHDQ